MSRHKRDNNENDIPISADNLISFRNKEKDLFFEYEIVELVKKSCPETKWGGLYFDPHTGKKREFDIQANYEYSSNANDRKCFKLAIECKNLKPSNPLVVFCSPRMQHEQTIDRLLWQEQTENSKEPTCCEVYTDNYTSFYRLNSLVGRSATQVRLEKDDQPESKWTFISDNSEGFAKWSQALSSIYGMLNNTILYNHPEKKESLVFLPIVVVPNGTLWKIDLSDPDKNPPCKEDEIRYWVDVSYTIGERENSMIFHISHLHFFTQRGLEIFFDQMNLSSYQAF